MKLNGGASLRSTPGPHSLQTVGNEENVPVQGEITQGAKRGGGGGGGLQGVC